MTTLPRFISSEISSQFALDFYFIHHYEHFSAKVCLFSVFFFHSIVAKFSASIKIIVIMALNELINRIVWVNFIAIKCTLPSKRAEELSTCVNLNRKSRPRTVLKLKIANRDVNKIGWRSKKAPLLSFYFKFLFIVKNSIIIIIICGLWEAYNSIITIINSM